MAFARMTTGKLIRFLQASRRALWITPSERGDAARTTGCADSLVSRAPLIREGGPVIYECDFDDLPDDRNLAFARLYMKARERLDNVISEAASNTYGGGPNVSAARAEFAATILGLATEFEIVELSTWSVADAIESPHFEAIVQQAATQRLVRSKSNGQMNLVQFDVDAKRTLRDHLEQMRRIIEESHEPGSRKAVLLRKLNVLAAEVDRGETRFNQVMSLAVEVAKTGGVVAEKIEPLVQQIVRIMAAWHGHEPALPPPAKPKQIEDYSAERRPAPKQRSFDRQLDDEIPF